MIFINLNIQGIDALKRINTFHHHMKEMGQNREVTRGCVMMRHATWHL